jgi:hypothetical protein
MIPTVNALPIGSQPLLVGRPSPQSVREARAGQEEIRKNQRVGVWEHVESETRYCTDCLVE